MNGKFKKSITCSNRSCARLAEVDFTEEIVKMVFLTGLVNDDVKREVLEKGEVLKTKREKF